MGLYSQEVVLMFQYFRYSGKDGWALPSIMGALILNDTFSTMTEMWCVYSYVISNW